MSKLVTFRMHDGRGGVVGLADVLALVPDNDWVWSILDFDGIGRVPDGLDYHEFRERVLASREGYIMSWSQLQDFSAGIRQCFDLLVVAVKDPGDLSPQKFAADDFGDCLTTLAAIDSGAWEVAVDDGVEAGSGFAAGLRARYGGEWR